MDDFTINSLTDSRNEYSALLITKITPSILQGIYSILNEAIQLCNDNNEEEKYLMTFQNFLTRVPKWNQEIVNHEVERIITQSNCNYLEDLITCVHIIHLKTLTVMRVGEKQKKIDIDIPKLSEFIHKVYIETSRKMYKTVFLFEQTISSLQKQKNIRETELLIKESILHVIRNSMPIETILRNYLDETVEETADEVKEEIHEENIFEHNTNTIDLSKNKDISQNIELPIEQRNSTTEKPNKENIDINLQKKNETINKRKTLEFNNIDEVVDFNNEKSPDTLETNEKKNIDAPKTIDRLDELNKQKQEEQKFEEENNEEKIKIFDNQPNMSLDIEDLSNDITLNEEDLLKDVVVLQ